MAKSNIETDPDRVSREIRGLAENLLKELEKGDVNRAVALVGELNEIRDRTLYHEIGRLTRSLHESIKNLQLETDVGASSEIASATDKLAYVLEMTDKSANRTMDLVDASMPLAQAIQEKAEEIEEKWQKFLRKELKPDEFRVLTKEINTFLQGSASNARKLKAQLSDIVLAQDFKDLTGQVIHKVAALAKDVEIRLVQLVVMAGKVDSITGITHADLDAKIEKEIDKIAAEGPQIDSTNANVVNNQDDVDDLLSSLGF